MAEADPENSISVALRSLRTHLGMQVAYVSEFVDNRSVFRQVDAPGLEHLIKVGDSQSLDDVYCRHILEGRIPNLMPDTAAVPLAAAMPITSAVPIGKHMSVPLRLESGEVYGMFCCLGPEADGSLNERDLQTMKVFADFAANEVRREVTQKRSASAKLQRIATAIADSQMSTVYQPIFNIQRGCVVGFECLTRFSATPYRSPDVWFKEAGEVELGATLEIAAIKLALTALRLLPSGIYLGVNASPATVTSAEFAAVFEGLPAHRIVLEITEHAQVEDYDALLRAIKPLRRAGIRLAVDDAGVGYSGLQHILRLEPDLIKLDISLTRNINEDVARRALAAALVNFAEATDTEIIAEGVETMSELGTLRSLAVQKAQGYLLGRPISLADAMCTLEYGLPAPAVTRGEGSGAAAAVDCALCAAEYGAATGASVPR